MLSGVQRITFYGFLMALAKDQGINQALGKTSLNDTALDFQSICISVEFRVILCFLALCARADFK